MKKYVINAKNLIGFLLKFTTIGSFLFESNAKRNDAVNSTQKFQT